MADESWIAVPNDLSVHEQYSGTGLPKTGQVERFMQLIPSITLRSRSSKLIKGRHTPSMSRQIDPFKAA